VDFDPSVPTPTAVVPGPPETGNYAFKAVFTDMVVRWGDGTTQTYTGDGTTVTVITHDYPTSKPEPLQITGAVTRIMAGAVQADKDKVVELLRLNLPGYTGNGDNELNVEAAALGEFAGCGNLQIAPECKLGDDITILNGTFQGCTKLGATANNLRWPVRLYYMYRTFAGAALTGLKGSPLPNSVLYMEEVFSECEIGGQMEFRVEGETYAVRSINIGVPPKKLVSFRDSALALKLIHQLPPDVDTEGFPNNNQLRKLVAVDATCTTAEQATTVIVEAQRVAEQRRAFEALITSLQMGTGIH